MTEGSAVSSPQAAVELLQDLHDRISQLIEKLSDERFGEPGTIGGGDWSAKDLIAHIESWERMAIETIEDWRADRYPRIHERFAAASGIDGLNAQILAEHQGKGASDARASFENTFLELRTLITEMSIDEWDRPVFYEPPVPTKSFGDAIGRVLGADAGPFAHSADHLEDLGAMVRSSLPQTSDR